MSKEKLQQEKSRGVLAQQILENPIYQEALVIIRGKLMVEFENTKYTEQQDRDEIWRQYQTLAKIEKQLQKVMRDGKIADKELSILDKLKNTIR